MTFSTPVPAAPPQPPRPLQRRPDARRDDLFRTRWAPTSASIH